MTSAAGWMRSAGVIAAVSAAAGTQASDAGTARAQLEVARLIRGEAVSIVALTPQSITAEEPNAPPFRKQNYTVTGRITRCFKGRMQPTATVTYIITSEGRPNALARPHVAFLRRMGGRWAAVDGPMFRDSAALRAGLAKITPGCGR